MTDLLPTLDHEEVARYSRHLILPEVGLEGQKKLKKASVLLVGAGGLGSPLALYLAAAGVGRLGLVDFDLVEASNLQRQIIHGTSRLGDAKIDSARDRLLELNPHITIDGYPEAITSDNALDLVRDYDVVADGTDNFPTRYLVNDACVLTGTPNAYGSIFRFEGQASVFGYQGGPCYRCLYEQPPPPGLVPSCAEGGVLGILPGLIGTIQATEVVKMILGIGETLSGRLLLYDALTMSFRELRLRRNPRCVLCGDHPTQTELVDYEQFCGGPPSDSSSPPNPEDEGFKRLSVQEVHSRLQQGWDPLIVDVRQPQEAKIVSLGAHLVIPHDKLLNNLDLLRGKRDLLVHCKLGSRSAKAAALLVEAGFGSVTTMEGGIVAWAEQIDPSLPTY